MRARVDRYRWTRAVAWLSAAVCLCAPLTSVHSQPARPMVALLPFEVHSAKPIAYLGESLANLIRERLAAGGEVAVMDPATVRTRLAQGLPAAPGDAELRRVAGEVDADFVVTGSLTELAGRFSLDVRVTPAALGVRSQTRVLTARDEEELTARVDELAQRILDQVLGAAPALVAGVELVGLGDLGEPLRRSLRTQAGEPYDPAMVRADLEMLRADTQVASASVETETLDEGVLVRFRVVPGGRLLPAPQRETVGRVVAEVRIRGNRRIEADAIRARIGTGPGERYSSVQIAKDVLNVNALGFFRNIRVYTEDAPEGLVVVFDVEENPVVRQISISGNDSIGGDKIRDVLTLTTGSTLDYPLLFENRSRIQALYRAEGYYLAEVSHEVEPLSEVSVGIHFVVEENEKLRLREISFNGNQAFSDSELRREFRTKTWKFWSYATSWFDRSGTYSEPLFVQDLRSVEKIYTDAGYLQVQISQPEVTASQDGLRVSVDIVEGDQFRVGQLQVSGDETVDVETLRERLQLKEGEIFNRSHLTEDVAELTAYYQNRGFFYASVEPLSNLAQGSRVVDVTFQVRKGPLYFIRQIDIAGNTTTVDSVIRREIPLVEGELYSQRQVVLSRARVERLGFFEEVDLRMEPTPEPEQLDLEVNVVEKPTGSFSFGAGFSSQDSFVVNGSLSQSNLFGRGWGVNISADVGGSTQRFFLSVTDPALFGSDFSLNTTIFRTTVNFEDFDQDQTGADLVLGHALSEDNRVRGFLRYSFAARDIDDDSNVNAAGVIFRELLDNTLTTSMMGLSFIADHRNDRISPTEGFQLGGALEVAGLGFFSRFVRLEGRGAWYLGAPRWLPERSTFVVSTRFGYALPLNVIGDFDFPEIEPIDLPLLAASDQTQALDQIDRDIELPLSERYFLGGLGQFQLRGFKARSVGPRRALLRPASGSGAIYTPVGRFSDGTCIDVPGNEFLGGNGNGKCNDIDDEDIDDFEDLDETDVVGGNKFISSSFEYRFPISETLGLQGILFLDAGNAFAEGRNLFDVTEWRYGTGGAVQWFSPFGPLMLVLGFPLDPLSVEKSPVFEFSVGGGGF